MVFFSKRGIMALKKKHEFMRVYKRGKFFVSSRMVMHILKNREGINRLGVSVSKKHGKAVKRNRLRRIIKEVFRYYEKTEPGFSNIGCDIVIVVNKPFEEASFAEIRKEMKYLFKKHKLM